MHYELILNTGGCYKLELFLPEEYPMAPPKARHCNSAFFNHVFSLVVVLQSPNWMSSSLPIFRPSTLFFAGAVLDQNLPPQYR